MGCKIAIKIGKMVLFTSININLTFNQFFNVSIKILKLSFCIGNLVLFRTNILKPNQFSEHLVRKHLHNLLAITSNTELACELL